MEEFKIQEDFLQMSELAETENAFINRSTPIDSTNRSLSYIYSNVPDVTNKDVFFMQERFIEYFGSPALLSEKISALNESVLDVWAFKGNFAGELDSWILGASYNDTLRINAKDEVKCGAHSCYEESLKSGKICKPGLYYALILFEIRIRKNKQFFRI